MKIKINIYQKNNNSENKIKQKNYINNEIYIN